MKVEEAGWVPTLLPGCTQQPAGEVEELSDEKEGVAGEQSS
jgi:hypothetical protein